MSPVKQMCFPEHSAFSLHGVASSWVVSVKYSAALAFAMKSYALEQGTEKWNFFHAIVKSLLSISHSSEHECGAGFVGYWNKGPFPDGKTV